MSEDNRTELLVKAAKLYYEYSYSQDEVAKRLDLSRSYISKLLNEARDAGIVKFKIIDPTQIESRYEKLLRERFNLKKVIVVPENPRGVPLAMVGKEATKYLESIVKNDDIIGHSWGETIKYCSEEFNLDKSLKNITSVQLCGGVTNIEYNNVYASEIANNFATGFSAKAYILPLPVIVDDILLKKLIRQDSTLGKVMELGEKANIALFTMGAFGTNSALVRAGYVNEEHMMRLVDNGAVGDVCSHFIDIDGNICSPEIDARTIAVSLDNIKAKEYRIGVAIGKSKIDSICGALRGNIVNVLVTNEITARSVLARLDELDN